jgi:queuosine precursor transporter
MILLIGAGGLISYIINADAARIAIASAIAFSGAMMVNALVYSFLIDKKWMVRSNGSNAPAAMVDSILFPTIAFGVFMPHIVLGQFLAKTLGGLFWSYVVDRFRGLQCAKQ